MAYMKDSTGKRLDSFEVLGASSPTFLPKPSGDTTGATDTAALNTALAQGGVIRPNPLVSSPHYYINAPLVTAQGGNTDIDWGTSIITELDGSNCNMLRNWSAQHANRTFTDGAITTGTATLTSATANFVSADIGQTVVIPGANVSAAGTAAVTARITAVNSATSVTIDTVAPTTVSGASCSIFYRDKNITVRGGFWDRGYNGWVNNQDPLASNLLYSMNWLHCDVVDIKSMSFSCTQRGYMLAFGDITYFSSDDITAMAPNTLANTDGINIHGPARGGRITNTRGTMGDDVVSIHTADGNASLWETVGDISDIEVDGVFVTNCQYAAVKIHAGLGTYLRGVRVNHLRGTLTAGPAVGLTGAIANSTSNINEIVISDVDIAGPNNKPVIDIKVSSNASSITLRDICSPSPLTGTTCVVNVQNGTSINDLTIDGVVLGSTTSSTTTSAPYAIVGVYGTVNNLVVSGVRAYAPGGNGLNTAGVYIGGTTGNVSYLSLRDWRVRSSVTTVSAVHIAGTCPVISMNNMYVTANMRLLLSTSTTATSMALTDIYMASAKELANISAAALTITANNVRLASPVNTAMVLAAGAASVVTLHGGALHNPSNIAAVSLTSGATARVNWPHALADLATLTKVEGDMVRNSNASLSCGIGLCAYSAAGTGNGWKQLVTGATY